MRPLARGLALFNGPRTNPPAPGVTSLVVNAMQADWSKLQPTETNFDLTAVAAGFDYAANVGVDGCDLRIFGGFNAPQWLKTKVGATEFVDGQDGTTGSTAHFWKPAYLTAAEKLSAVLADRFAANPRLRSVGHWVPMTLYAEPFMRGDRTTRTKLAAAGLTDTVDLAAHKAAVDIHRRVWAPHGVRLRLALNPWHSLDNVGASSVDRLCLVVDYAVEQLGVDGVILQNNSIRTPTLAGSYPSLYALMQEYRKAGVPIAFQTAGDSLIGDVAATLRWAVAQGAHWLEPAPGVWKQPAELLREISGALSANVADDPTGPLRDRIAELEALLVEQEEANSRLTAEGLRLRSLLDRIGSIVLEDVAHVG